MLGKSLVFCAAILFFACIWATWYQQDRCSRLLTNEQTATEHESANANAAPSSSAPQHLITSGAGSTFNIASPLVQDEHAGKRSQPLKRPWTEHFICDAKFTDVVLGWFTLLLVYVTGGLIWIGVRQEQRMRDTAQRQLRAYLSIEGFPYRSHMNPTTNAVWWSIHPVWRNGGDTPTVSLFLNVNSSRDKQLPDNFDFPDAQGETIQMVVGAHSTVAASTITISGTDLAAVSNGTKFLYIWGWAKYRDIFSNTPERITRFCVQVTHVLGDPTNVYNQQTNPLELTFAFYKQNNCIDEGCQRQEA